MKSHSAFVAMSFAVLANATSFAQGGGIDTAADEAALEAQNARLFRAQSGHHATNSQLAMQVAPRPYASGAQARWVPKPSDTWQWQLTGNINTSHAVKVYDIDLFDAPQSVFAALRAQGKYIVCYFSAGSSENWRPDFGKFRAADLGNPLDGWAGEKWLDTRSANVRKIMAGRLDLAKRRGCDGVEPDNVDGYTNRPGFPLTARTQLDFNRYIAAQARQRGLLVGLKNDVDQVAALEPFFDFAVNEQCHHYKECGVYTAFTHAGKPVFNVEYRSSLAASAADRAGLCAASRAANLRTLVLPVELDGKFRYSCD